MKETGLSIKVRAFAILWWKAKKPVSWDLMDYLVMPDINCSTDEEIVLARAVAELLRSRIPERNRKRRKLERERTKCVP